MSQQKFKAINSFKGINQSKGDDATEEMYSYCWDMQNCKLVNGCIERADSPKQITFSVKDGKSLSGKITGEFYEEINGRIFNILGCGTSLYLKNGDILEEIYSELSADSAINFSVYDDLITICNAKDTPIQYDGFVCESIIFNDPDSIWLNTIPLGSVVYANRLFYYTKNRKLLSPQPATNNNFDNTYNTVASMVVESGQGSELVNAVAYNGDILPIYTKSSVIRLSGSQPDDSSMVDPFIIRHINPKKGCIAPRSIIHVGNDQYFLSNDGFQSLLAVQNYGDVATANVFENIKQDFYNLRLKDNIGDSVSVYDEYNNKILLYVRGWNDTTICYGIDVKTGDIEKYVYNFIVTSAIYIEPHVYVGTSLGTYYCVSDSYFDTSESYFELMYYGSKYGKSVLKKWDRLVLDVETDSILNNLVVQIKHYKDNTYQSSYTNETETVTPGEVLDGYFTLDISSFATIGAGKVTLKNLGKSTAIKIRFYCNSANEHFRIKNLELFFTPLGVRK